MDSSYILWDKFQDYQLKFILTNLFFGNSLTRYFMGSSNLVYWLPDNMTLIIVISIGDFQIRWNVLSLSFSERKS